MEEQYTETDWIDEIADYFVTDIKQVGDWDKHDIARRYGVCPDTALRKMKEIAMANPGDYEVVRVRDGKGPPYHVLRKVYQKGI